MISLIPQSEAFILYEALIPGPKGMDVEARKRLRPQQRRKTLKRTMRRLLPALLVALIPMVFVPRIAAAAVDSVDTAAADTGAPDTGADEAGSMPANGGAAAMGAVAAQNVAVQAQARVSRSSRASALALAISTNTAAGRVGYVICDNPRPLGCSVVLQSHLFSSDKTRFMSWKAFIHYRFRRLKGVRVTGIVAEGMDATSEHPRASIVVVYFTYRGRGESYGQSLFDHNGAGKRR